MKINLEEFEQKRRKTHILNILYKISIIFFLIIIESIIVIVPCKLNELTLKEIYISLILVWIFTIVAILELKNVLILPEIKPNKEFKEYISQNIIIPNLENIGFYQLETNFKCFNDKSLIFKSLIDEIIAESNIVGKYRNRNFEFENFYLRRTAYKKITQETKGFCIAQDYESKISSNIIIYSKKTKITPRKTNYTKVNTSDNYFQKNYNFYMKETSQISKYIESGLLEKIRKLEEILNNEVMQKYKTGYKGIVITIIDGTIFIGIEINKSLFKIYLNNDTLEDINNKIKEDSQLLKEILDIFIN